MTNVVMTIGLPRSGKSTWAKEYAKENGYTIVNRDSVRVALHGQAFFGPAETMVAAIIEIMAEALVRVGTPGIVIDECHVSFKRRQPWVKFCDRLELGVPEYKYFFTPMHTCIARAHETGQSYLEPVIRRMAKEWDLNDIYSEDE